MARAEPALGRRPGPRGAVDDPRGRPGLVALPRPRLSAPVGARGRRRVLVLLDRSEPLLVLGDADAGAEGGDARDGARHSHGAAQDGARHRRGAGARAESDRSLVRLPGGFDPPARRPPRTLRADRRLGPQGVLHREDPRGHGRRPHAGGPRLVRAGQKERRRPVAEVLMTTGGLMRPRLPGPVTVRVVLVLMALLVFGPAAAAPPAHREVLPNGIVLLVAQRPAVPLAAGGVPTPAGAGFTPPGPGGPPPLTGPGGPRGGAPPT